MMLTNEEHQKIEKSIKALQELFKNNMEKIPKINYETKEIDNEFVKMIGEKYLSFTGLLDLLVDYDMLAKAKDPCECAAPCQATCVQPCASVCNAYSNKPN